MSNIQNNDLEASISFKDKIKNYIDNNIFKIILLAAVVGIFINLFLYLFTPILFLPVYKYQQGYSSPIQSDEYFTVELRTNLYIVPYTDIAIYCESDDIIDIYLFTLYQYSVYQDLKSSGGDLTDIDYIFFHNNFQRRMFLIELGNLDLFKNPIYIVIDPNNDNLIVSLNYELRVFEKFWYILSFILLIITLSICIYLAIKNYRNDPWKNFHVIIYNNGYKLYKKGFFDKSIASINNGLESFLKSIQKKYPKRDIQKNQLDAYGVSLLKNLFNEKDPIIYTNEVTTKQGKINQKDNKLFFVSCFKKFRNPFAHTNFKLKKDETLRKLMFLDEMLKMFEKCYVKDENGNNINIFNYVSNINSK